MWGWDVGRSDQTALHSAAKLKNKSQISWPGYVDFDGKHDIECGT